MSIELHLTRQEHRLSLYLGNGTGDLHACMLRDFHVLVFQIPLWT
jgi:hypothetical protein